MNKKKKKHIKARERIWTKHDWGLRKEGRLSRVLFSSAHTKHILHSRSIHFNLVSHWKCFSSFFSQQHRPLSSKQTEHTQPSTRQSVVDNRRGNQRGAMMKNGAFLSDRRANKTQPARRTTTSAFPGGWAGF